MNDMTKDRLSYIDVSKGILMLFVIYGHIDGHATEQGFSNPAINDIHLLVNIFVSFYMPCFFLITGYCSNFKKPFLPFLISKSKSILIPVIFFTFIFSRAWKLQSEELHTFIFKMLLYGGNYWFLSSLFLALILFWLIRNYCNEKFTYVLCSLSFILGFILSPMSHEYEFWWFVHSLCLMPYICIGQYLRKKGILKWGNMGVYRLLLLFVTFFSVTTIMARYDVIHKDCFFDVPGVTQSFINFNSSFFFFFIVLSIVGSLFIIEFSKRIETNTFLEFLGKNSLVIYCIHGDILRRSVIAVSLLGREEFENNYWICLLLLITAFISTIVLCCIVAWFFNLKYLRLFIGKF